MSHAPQPDPRAEPVVQEFLQHLKANAAYGIRTTTIPRIEQLIVSPATVRDYFVKDSSRAHRLLKAVFGNSTAGVRASDIWKDHTIFFTILLCVGRGEYIQYCLKHRLQLSDAKLPFDTRPTNFPVSINGEGEDFYEAFVKQQWQFWPYRFAGNTDDTVEPERFLPIVACEQIGSGGSAIAYRIKIDPEYDSLRRNEAEEETQTTMTLVPKEYVLKTYNTTDAQSYYYSEIDAFRRLQDSDTPCDNIIGYHGSFIKGDTYNVLLEYADGNGAKDENGADGHTLEHYFQTIDPPTSGPDILMFWRRLFDVIQGLRCIHVSGEGDTESADGPPIFQGWHQDVKPSNILVCSRIGGSAYDCDFKLADLGLSHFRKIENKDPGTDIDTQGSRTYGAPECCRDKFLEYTRLKVKPLVDIWSLGCVFSEAAVWLVLGKTGLEKYRRQRRSETQQIHGFHDHGCFHDSKMVLESVSDMHNEVSGSVRSCDFISKAVVGSKRMGTRPLVKGLVTEMLTTKDRRLNAEQVRGSAEDILREAEAALEEAAKEQSLAVRSQTFPTGTKRPPPVLPTSNSDPPPILDAAFEERPRQQARPLSGESSGLSNTPVTSTPSSHKTPPTSPRIRDFRAGHGKNLSVNTFSGPNTPTRPGADDLRNGLVGLGLDVQNTSGLDAGDPSNRYVRPQQHETHHSAMLPSREGKEPEAKLTIGELLQYLADRKTDQPTRLNGDWLLADLKRRDYVFLIDNASSMRPHWDTLVTVFRALAGLVKQYDKNGLDLLFTMSEERHNFKKRNEVLHIIRGSQPREGHRTCDITKKLDLILREYQDGLRLRSRSFVPIFGHKKPITIFVLTDAVWQEQSDPAGIIKKAVTALQDPSLNAREDQIGIQFIRFGNREDLKERLERLDSGLGLVPDIVDAEACDGNVWKMLLGSTNKTFDNDKKEPLSSPQELPSRMTGVY